MDGLESLVLQEHLDHFPLNTWRPVRYWSAKSIVEACMCGSFAVETAEFYMPVSITRPEYVE